MRVRRMRWFAILAFAGAFPAFGDVLDSVFMDYSSWATEALGIPAVSGIVPITFSSEGISSSLLSIQSGNGRIVNDTWSDCVGNCGNLNGYFGNGTGATTVLTFTKPTYGFGADWTFLGADGSLVLIQNGANDQWVPLELNPDDGLHNYVYSGDGFFGVVSPIPFTQIVIWTDFENDSGYQAYSASEMYVAPDPPISTPEPGALALLLTGLSGVALSVCSRRK